MINNDTNYTNDTKYQQVKNDIKQFLSLVGSHSFTSSQIDQQYNYITRDAKRYRWQVLDRYVKADELELLKTNTYRKIDQQLEIIDWQEADIEDVVKVKWPLELEKYIKTYHQSITVIAGAPGSGKTGFLYDFALRNMNHPMVETIFSNDMTPEEVKERMLNSDIKVPNPPPFQMFERHDNFADVIKPDGINLIDYLDLNSEVYRIGDEIEAIYRKLKRGIALIAIQKKPFQNIGLGGIFSWKRAKLYLSLDTIKELGEMLYKLEVVKARGRAKPTVNPRGMVFKFRLIGGCKFYLKESGHIG